MRIRTRANFPGQSFKGYVNISNQTGTIGGAVIMGDATGELSFVNSTFSGNKVERRPMLRAALFITTERLSSK